jgi:NAD+ synthase
MTLLFQRWLSIFSSITYMSESSFSHSPSSLRLSNPQNQVDQAVEFIRQTFKQQKISTVVIAVSGGIDSSLALTLLVKALGPQHVQAVSLPYGSQSTELAALMCQYLDLPADHYQTIDIKPVVDAAQAAYQVSSADHVRLGNLKARARMMAIFDKAKELGALVCGTENKSEHYLGYFTRFGDAASDIEPLSHFYKTQVRQLAQHLGLPEAIQTQPPSAGLWAGQTDEQELGFTYAQADQVLHLVVDQQQQTLLEVFPDPQELVSQLPDLQLDTITRVLAKVRAQAFKRQVPYIS